MSPFERLRLVQLLPVSNRGRPLGFGVGLAESEIAKWWWDASTKRGTDRERERERERKRREGNAEWEALRERERRKLRSFFFLFFFSFSANRELRWRSLNLLNRFYITVNSDFRLRRNHFPANYGRFLVMRDEINIVDIADSVEEERSKDG